MTGKFLYFFPFLTMFLQQELNTRPQDTFKPQVPQNPAKKRWNQEQIKKPNKRWNQEQFKKPNLEERIKKPNFKPQVSKIKK